MNFLGRQPLHASIEVHDGAQEEVTIPNRSSKVYPGVVVLCLPELAECNQQRISIDFRNIQVNWLPLFNASASYNLPVHYILGKADGRLCSWRDDEATQGGF